MPKLLHHSNQLLLNDKNGQLHTVDCTSGAKSAIYSCRVGNLVSRWPRFWNHTNSGQMYKQN